MRREKRISQTDAKSAANADGSTLTVPRIVSVARRIVEDEGVGGVTMRRIASELDVTPMALYNHVASKQALLALVADSVISSVPDSLPGSAPWQVRLRDEFLAVHKEIDRYPGLGLYITGGREFYPSGLRKFHNSLALLKAAGFDEDEALAATYLLIAFQGGYFLLDQPANEGRTAENASAKSSSKRLTKKDVLAQHDVQRGLETLVAGFEAQLAAKHAR